MNLYFWIIILGLSFCKSKTIKISYQPTCNMTIGETMPTDLTYDNLAPVVVPIWKIWQNIINNSKEILRLTSFYWTMLNNDTSNQTYFPTSKKGEQIFNLLLEKSKAIPLEIVQNGNEETNDLKILKQNKLTKIYYIDFNKLLHSGIQHSKVWIGDNYSAFIGSANMDWRAISEIKELGIYILNCSEIVQDIVKFWKTLQYLSGPNGTVPIHWPVDLFPKYNLTNQFKVIINGMQSSIYTATSPHSFNTPYRTDDLTAILNTINQAKKYIYISVMDFLPENINYIPNSKTFWPVIEDQLKTAAINNKVSVKLLISWWPHSSRQMLTFLKSLAELSKIKNIHIQVKLFIVPAFKEYQRQIPFSRVSHSKYMVTDNTLYIGTSNWSGDYFTNTGGISFICQELVPDSKNLNSIRSQLQNIFYTDWESVYAHDLP